MTRRARRNHTAAFNPARSTYCMPIRDPVPAPIDGQSAALGWVMHRNKQRRSLYLSVAKVGARGDLGGGREPVVSWGERARV
jgi:hypothetical protein